MFDGYASVTVTGKLLKKVVTDYSDVLSEPSRFEGLLKDIYGSENKKEIFLLITALKAKITDIRGCNIYDNDTESKIYNMITRLSSDFGLEDRSAAWVTIAWSIGFDLMTEVEYDNLVNGTKAENYSMLSNYVAHMDTGIQQVEISKSNPISNLLMVNATNLKQLYENGILLHNQGKFAEALECYDKALAIDPHNSNVLSNKGLSLHNQGKYAEALECYDKALALNSQDEFIIKRRNNTREIAFHSSSNLRSGRVIGQVSTLNSGIQKSINLYILGTAIAAVCLISGIAAYLIFGTDSGLEVNPLRNNSQLTSDASINNIDLTNEGSESPRSTINKESISDFTNNIERELNLQITSENQSLLQNVNKSVLHSHSGDSQSNDMDFDSLNGVDQKVDNFKTELGKAMNSNFS
ncbi:MAG: tetratricopeptide repeat protein [Nitrosopumilus sp.]|nr:tetratricopeptide repeat protein [Nitrosopumilus sp.]